jgi:hypothetical protein
VDAVRRRSRFEVLDLRHRRITASSFPKRPAIEFAGFVRLEKSYSEMFTRGQPPYFLPYHVLPYAAFFLANSRS